MPLLLKCARPCVAQLLRFTFAFLFILVGIDKWTNYLTNWQHFISPTLGFLPISPTFFIRFFGLIQIGAGILFLTPYYRAASWISMALLLIIFFNLLTLKPDPVVITHDIVMILLLEIFMEVTNNFCVDAHRAKLLLKYTYGLVFIVAGADKFINLVTQWTKYVSPFVLNILPVSLAHLIMAVGILEIVIGILILSPKTRIGAYLAAVWLLIIVANLLSMGMYFDIAVRDVVMAVGAIALAWLA